MVSGIEALGSSPLMHGMGEEELGSLLSTMKRRIYEPGDTILEEGTPSDRLFISADVIATCETRILAFPKKVLTTFFACTSGPNDLSTQYRPQLVATL